MCSPNQQLILPTHAAPPPPTRSWAQSCAPTNTHYLPARLATFSYPNLQHAHTHSSPTQAAIACSPAKPRSLPFFHFPWATHKSPLCRAARPVHGSQGGGGGRQAPGRPVAALGGGGAASRRKGAMWSPKRLCGVCRSRGLSAQCDPAACHAFGHIVSHILACLPILLGEAEARPLASRKATLQSRQRLLFHPALVLPAVGYANTA